MLIKCPKCRSIYDIPDNIIPDEGLKMRCSECSEIWTAYPEDALKKVTTSTKSLQKMFKQISKETDDLFANEKETTQKIEKIRITVPQKSNYILYATVTILVLLSFFILMYTLRFEIVRVIPQTENLYLKMNIKSIPYGTNLEFNNINSKEYIENNISKLEIKGMVSNNSEYVTEIPPVKIEIFNKNGKILFSHIEKLPLPRLKAGYNILFSKTINNPTPLAKSIYVTFEDNK